LFYLKRSWSCFNFEKDGASRKEGASRWYYLHLTAGRFLFGSIEGAEKRGKEWVSFLGARRTKTRVREAREKDP
jgi:hypothetical protein